MTREPPVLMNDTAAKAPQGRERSFGFSVGGVLCVIAAILWWRGRIERAEVAAATGAFLVVAALLYAPLLKHPSAAWWRLSRALGYVNARVLLTVLFATVLVPLSVVWWLTDRDPLERRRGKFSGWRPYPARYRARKHYERMY